MLTEDRPNISTDNQVFDIDLSTIRKKRFRIDGDNNRILELNVSDLNILGRIKETYPKLEKLSEKAVNSLSDTDTDFMESTLPDALRDIDEEMRAYIDYIFDSNVSEICAPDGSMYDPFNGKLRFEHIIEVIGALYENNLDAEINKMTKRVSKHTKKYIK